MAVNGRKNAPGKYLLVTSGIVMCLYGLGGCLGSIVADPLIISIAYFVVLSAGILGIIKCNRLESSILLSIMGILTFGIAISLIFYEINVHGWDGFTYFSAIVFVTIPLLYLLGAQVNILFRKKGGYITISSTGKTCETCAYCNLDYNPMAPPFTYLCEHERHGFIKPHTWPSKDACEYYEPK